MTHHSKAKAMVLSLSLSFLAHWIALPSQGVSTAGHTDGRAVEGAGRPAGGPLGVAGVAAVRGIAWPHVAMDTSPTESDDAN